MLGESGATAIFFHLKMSDSDYEDPVRFHRKLQGLFAAGTPALEKVIVTALGEGMNLPLRSDQEGDFVTSVLDAKRTFIAGETRRRTR